MKSKKTCTIDRRDFLKGLGAFGVTTAAGLAFPSLILGKAKVDKSKLAKELKFSSYGGSWQKNLTKCIFPAKPDSDSMRKRIRIPQQSG